MKKEDTLSLETENVDKPLRGISVSFKKKQKSDCIPNREGGRSRNLKLYLKLGSKTVGIFSLYN